MMKRPSFSPRFPPAQHLLWLGSLIPQCPLTRIGFLSFDGRNRRLSTASLLGRTGSPLKFQLGLPLVSQSATADRSCPFCLCQMDSFGDHVLTCSAGNLYGRHNQFHDGLSVLLQDSSYVVRREIPVPNSPEALRPADLLVGNTSVGSPIALNVSLVHPLQASLPQAAALPGTLAHHRAQLKV